MNDDNQISMLVIGGVSLLIIFLFSDSISQITGGSFSRLSDETNQPQPLIIPTPQATQPPPPAPALPTLAPTPTRRIEQPQPQTASDETFNCMPITDLQVFLECHFYLPPGCEVRAMSKYAGGPLVFTAEDARARWGPEQPYNGWMVINGINETWLSNCHLTQIQRDRDLSLGQ